LDLQDLEFIIANLLQDLVDTVFDLLLVGLDDVVVYEVEECYWTVDCSKPRKDCDQKGPNTG